LPVLERRDNSTIDGWGHPIHYDITGATMVTLSSPGAGRSTGGPGAGGEIIVAFDASKDR
jgi:hypothetical protein